MGNYVRSVVRALAILRCFSSEEQELSLSAISRRVGFSVPTTLRIIRTLESEQFIQKKGERRYALGLSSYMLGLLSSAHFKPKDVVFSYMESMRDITYEAVTLYAPAEGYRVCYEHIDSPYDVGCIARVGSTFPLFAGAGGRALLAFMDEEVVAQQIERSHMLTSNTITDHSLLRQSLEEVKRSGYAISAGEQEVGVNSIAAPIFDRWGNLKFSIAISGPEYRFTRPVAEKFVQDLIVMSRKISAMI